MDFSNNSMEAIKSSKEPKPLPRRKMLFTTTAILFGNLTFGCCLNVLPPALDNLRSKYNTTIDGISMVFTISTICYCIGAIACGFLSNCMNRQLIAIGSLTGSAFSIYMTPYCPTKIFFFVIGGLLGFSSGMYDSTQMVWIIEIWQHKSGPFIQAQHFCYAIGAIIPSLIVAPFLNENDHSSNTEMPQIHIPFLIIGTLTTLAVMYQSFLFIFCRYRTPPMYANDNFELIDDAKNTQCAVMADFSENISNNEHRSDNFMGVSKRKIQLVSLTVWFLGCYGAMEVSTMQFLPIFGQYSSLKLPESVSSYVLTLLTGMFAVGRLIGILIISKVRSEVILVANFILVLTGNFILLHWANNNLLMFWIGSAILGAGYSTIFPSYCAFIEKYLVFTSAIASSTIVLGATISSIYPLIIGRIIEHHAVVLTYTNFFSTFVCAIALFWSYKLTRQIVNRER
ncbi:Sodium-dependent glucose transporter 1 [Pseudolycoriella hygida]|uniref:Sodium-dependent glucose transporter 1 n=1 Tax=Pseudolycoriella hygida TaxID=35572 RepID=A0A9Q0NH38_9DIPT|nr:Sodium-dependent glucose transporter 1 [Pseudolycoriella hygida]